MARPRPHSNTVLYIDTHWSDTADEKFIYQQKLDDIAKSLSPDQIKDLAQILNHQYTVGKLDEADDHADESY